MSIKTIAALIPTWYTLKSDITQETQFLIKPLSEIERISVAGINEHKLLGDTIMATLKLCVSDFKGITDEAGVQLKFATEVLEHLPAAVIAEIAQQIVSISSIESAERKN